MGLAALRVEPPTRDQLLEEIFEPADRLGRWGRQFGAARDREEQVVTFGVYDVRECTESLLLGLWKEK